MPNLAFKLGLGSLKEAKEAYKKLDPEFGDILVYIDNANKLQRAARIMGILSNIEYIESDEEKKAPVKLDFLFAAIESKNKILVSARELEEKEEDLEEALL